MVTLAIDVLGIVQAVGLVVQVLFLVENGRVCAYTGGLAAALAQHDAAGVQKIVSGDAMAVGVDLAAVGGNQGRRLRLRCRRMALVQSLAQRVGAAPRLVAAVGAADLFAQLLRHLRMGCQTGACLLDQLLVLAMALGHGPAHFVDLPAEFVQLQCHASLRTDFRKFRRL